MLFWLRQQRPMTRFLRSSFKLYRRQLAWLSLLVVGLLPRILSARTFPQQFERHRRLNRVFLPIWLYVSVTGVAIYFMLRA